MMVMVVMVLTEGQAMAALVIKVLLMDMCADACIFLTDRNNEMIHLIAKYFL